MTLRVGDLSAPVLAIIVTIGVIAAGLVLMGWFWWFAPTVGKAGALIVVGQPVLINKTSSVEEYGLTIVLRNIGNADVRIESIVVKDVHCSISSDKSVIGAGETVILKDVLCRLNISSDEYVIEGIVITDAGIHRFSANIV